MKYATVVDSGMWVEMACRLAREDIQCNYYSAWESADVSIRHVAPGSGLEDEGVTRVDDPFVIEKYREDSIFIFPWLHQEHLANMSHSAVFGATSKEATYLERDRKLLYDTLKKGGQPVPKTDFLHGWLDLLNYLMSHENGERYIKVSNWRGDIETYHHTDAINSTIELAAWKKRLGPFAESITFMAQEPIESEIEVGVDTFFCGGQFLAPAVIGYERKDEIYAGKVTETLPDWMHDVTMSLEPYLKKVNYNNFFTNEMRVTSDRTAYITDVTARCPIPPGAALLEAIDNLPDIIEAGAANRAAEVRYNAKYLVEMVINCPTVKDDWLEVRFPKDLRRWVKMRNVCKVDGRYWIPPNEHMSQVVSVVGLGQTLEEAKEAGREVAEEVCKKTRHAEFDDGSFDEIDEYIEKGEKLGVAF